MEPEPMIHLYRLAEHLLSACLPAAEREYLLGDLAEEYNTVVVPARGPRAARWWFIGQILRSMPPLCYRAWERATLGRACGAVVCGGVIATVPPVLLTMLRAFVLQQVPLKSASDVSITFAAALFTTAALSVTLATAVAASLLNTSPDDR
jgi:hypothetical protein